MSSEAEAGRGRLWPIEHSGSDSARGEGGCTNMLYAYAAKDNGVNGSACREGEPAPPTHPHAHLVDEDVVAIQLEAVLVVDHGWLDREKTPDDEVLPEEGGRRGGGGGDTCQGGGEGKSRATCDASRGGCEGEGGHN